MTARRATGNSKALKAFSETKSEIDAMLARLQALSDEHFEATPDEVNWGDVGSLKDHAGLLRCITDSAFQEVEFAE